MAAAGNENVQLKHLLSINSDTSEGVSTPQYDAASTWVLVFLCEHSCATKLTQTASSFPSYTFSSFIPVIENKVVVEGDFETQFNVALSKPSLTSASEVAVAVPETQYVRSTSHLHWVCTVHSCTAHGDVNVL